MKFFFCQTGLDLLYKVAVAVAVAPGILSSFKIPPNNTKQLSKSNCMIND